jgi:hypothetical protein
MNIQVLERELRYRTHIPYQWNARQGDAADAQTNFIYRCTTFDQVHRQASACFGETSERYHYALNRWFNFQSAQAVEYFFARHPRVRPEPNTRHQSIDFYLDGIPFDHKTTVWPRGYPGTFDDAVLNPQGLALWLYRNQSTQRRYHTANRIFLVLFADDREHWRMKAHLGLLAARIEEYLDAFTPAQLITVPVAGSPQADVIFVTDW